MRLAEQWQDIERDLPDDWRSVRLSLSIAEDADPGRAALILASLAPGRSGSGFRLEVSPARNPAGIFARLDRDGIRGRLDLLGTERAPAQVVEPQLEQARVPLARQWDELTADLPGDWSELYVDLELDSSDYLARAALLAAPLNPAHYGGPLTLRFRSASRAGYGTAPEMVRRCFERLDAERISGSVRILRALSHTSHVSTQGPVWRVGGRSV
jgi:hypothetical protein